MTQQQTMQELQRQLEVAEASRDLARSTGQLEEYMAAYCRVEAIEACLLSLPLDGVTGPRSGEAAGRTPS
jgi:hypothetical protein